MPCRWPSRRTRRCPTSTLASSCAVHCARCSSTVPARQSRGTLLYSRRQPHRLRSPCQAARWRASQHRQACTALRRKRVPQSNRPSRVAFGALPRTLTPPPPPPARAGEQGGRLAAAAATARLSLVARISLRRRHRPACRHRRTRAAPSHPHMVLRVRSAASALGFTRAPLSSSLHGSASFRLTSPPAPFALHPGPMSPS